MACDDEFPNLFRDRSFWKQSTGSGQPFGGRGVLEVEGLQADVVAGGQADTNFLRFEQSTSVSEEIMHVSIEIRSV